MLSAQCPNFNFLNEAELMKGRKSNSISVEAVCGAKPQGVALEDVQIQSVGLAERSFGSGQYFVVTCSNSRAIGSEVVQDKGFVTPQMRPRMVRR